MDVSFLQCACNTEYETLRSYRVIPSGQTGWSQHRHHSLATETAVYIPSLAAQRKAGINKLTQVDTSLSVTFENVFVTDISLCFRGEELNCKWGFSQKHLANQIWYVIKTKKKRISFILNNKWTNLIDFFTLYAAFGSRLFIVNQPSSKRCSAVSSDLFSWQEGERDQHLLYRGKKYFQKESITYIC